MPLNLFSRLSMSARRVGGASSDASRLSPRGSERSPPAHSLRVSRPAPSIALEPEPTQTEEAFEVIARNPTETVAIAGDCVIVLIGRTMSASGVHAVQRGCEKLQSRYDRF